MSLTPEQQERRKNLITCSRLPAILGKSEYAHPIDVYTAMVYGEQEQTDEGRKRAMKAGSRHESAILGEFAEQMDCKLFIPEDGVYKTLYPLAVGSDHPATFVYPEKLQLPRSDFEIAEESHWFGGTPDAIIQQGSQFIRDIFDLQQSAVGAVVQAKCVSSRKAYEWGESQFGLPPESVILQVWGEIILAKAKLKTDVNFGFVVALIGEPTQADYRFYKIELDAETEEFLLSTARDFWQIVQRRDVAALSPEGNWKPFFEREWPKEKIEKVQDQDGSYGVLWQKLAKIRADLAMFESAKEGLENTVKLSMQDAGIVYGDLNLGKNGALFKWTKTKDSHKVDDSAVAVDAHTAGMNALAAASKLVTKKKAPELEKIIAEFPKLEALRKKHSKPVIGSRRFCIQGLNNGKVSE